MTDSFWAATDRRDYQSSKKNETDFDSFRDFQAGINENFSRFEKEKDRTERVAALAKWDESLSGRWATARFDRITKPVVEKLQAALKREKRGSYWLTGPAGAGKTFVGYALIRRLIGMGVVTPSHVKVISENNLLSWASQGFKGQDMLNELFHKRYEVYLFDGIGSLNSSEIRKVAPIWEQLIEHIYSHDKIAIFTSSEELHRFVESFSPSAETKMLTLVEGNKFPVEVDGSAAEARGEVGEQSQPKRDSKPVAKRNDRPSATKGDRALEKFN